MDMVIYNYAGVQKFYLLIKLNVIVNSHSGYFSSEISAQQGSSCKKLNMYPFVHIQKKPGPLYIFTVIFVHLDVVIREGELRFSIMSWEQCRIVNNRSLVSQSLGSDLFYSQGHRTIAHRGKNRFQDL